MAQSQSRLITKALKDLEEFEDRYGLNMPVQTLRYKEAIKGVRPDLDDGLVLRLLPMVRRKSKKPLIGRMTDVSAT